MSLPLECHSWGTGHAQGPADRPTPLSFGDPTQPSVARSGLARPASPRVGKSCDRLALGGALARLGFLLSRPREVVGELREASAARSVSTSARVRVSVCLSSFGAGFLRRRKEKRGRKKGVGVASFDVRWWWWWSSSSLLLKKAVARFLIFLAGFDEVFFRFFSEGREEAASGAAVCVFLVVISRVREEFIRGG